MSDCSSLIIISIKWAFSMMTNAFFAIEFYVQKCWTWPQIFVKGLTPCTLMSSWTPTHHRWSYSYYSELIEIILNEIFHAWCNYLQFGYFLFSGKLWVTFIFIALAVKGVTLKHPSRSNIPSQKFPSPFAPKNDPRKLVQSQCCNADSSQYFINFPLYFQKKSRVIWHCPGGHKQV